MNASGDLWEERFGGEQAACWGCKRVLDAAEIYICDQCGKHFCPDCWEGHRREDCCGEAAAVKETQA